MSKGLTLGADPSRTGAPSRRLEPSDRSGRGRLPSGILFAHYRIERLLARGAMGEVYEATDQRLGRAVALKLLTASEMSSCLQEARAAAVSHPVIPALFEAGEVDGLPYLTFELMKGESLAERLTRGPLPLLGALKLSIQIADALRAIHAAGFTHGDLKPANVIITEADQARLLDFGLAVAPGDAVPSHGRFSGSPDFQPPEQLAGEPPDHRSDLFQLGQLLYLAVTGRHPFRTSDDPTAAPDRFLPLSLEGSVVEIPLELDGIVRRCLKRDPQKRYRSAEEVAGALRALHRRLEGSSSAVLERSAGSPAEPRFRERSIVPTLTASVGAALAVSLLHLWIVGSGVWWILSGLAVGAMTLVGMLHRGRRRPTGSAVSEETAFRGLVPFLEADQDHFFGRDLEVQAVLPLIRDAEFRFGVLHGESGAGKTSFLRAGLIPRLREAGFLPILTRSYRDPIQSILEQVRKLSPQDLDSGAPAVEQLRGAARRLDTHLVLICDQFEEFFTHFKHPDEIRPFIDCVAECYHHKDLPIRFLFCLRNDSLHQIANHFDTRIPEPLISSRRFHLRHFGVRQAAEVIDASARRAGIDLSLDFCRKIAADLARHGQVMPSELQIVGTQLQSRRITTMQEYRRAGGKESLVWSYLEEVLQACPDREIALRVLRSMIADDDSRRTVTQLEIVRRTRCGRQIVRETLRILTASRLVRELQDQKPWCYELVHEYLITRIQVLTGRIQSAEERANQLFRQYLSNSAVDEKVRIPLSRLWFIRRHSDLERGPRERALLAASLRAGLSRLALATILLTLTTIVMAGLFSLQDEWRSLTLNDGHSAAVRLAAFSPDGSRLATVGEDGAAIVWDFARRRRLATLKAHRGWVDAIAFDPLGRWFATGGNGGDAIVWDAQTFREVKRLSSRGRPVLTATFSPDGSRLAVADSERTICWSVPGWKRQLEFPTGFSFGNLLFSPDSRILMTSGGTTFDLVTGRRPQGRPEVKVGGNWAALLPERNEVVYAGPDGSLVFHRLDTGEVTRLENAHEDHLRAVAVSSDGTLLASAAEDIALWDPIRHRLLTRFEQTGVVWGLTFSPDGRYLVSTHGDGNVLLWDLAQRRRAGSLLGHAGPVRSVAFSPGDDWLASGGEEGAVIIWDLLSQTKRTVLTAHQSRVLAVAAGRHGKVLATGDWRGRIIVWDVARTTPRWTHEGSSAVYALTVSPDSSLLAANTGLFDLMDGRRLSEFTGPSGENASSVYGIDFSPDGELLAYTSIYGNLILFDTRKLRLAYSYQLPGINLVSVAFSPDGEWLVTGEDEGAVRLWRSSPLSPATELGRHSARVKSVTFSPDGRSIVSAGDDEQIRIWDLESRTLIQRISSHTGPVLSVDVSAGGLWLASGGQDRTVRLHRRTRTVWGYALDTVVRAERLP